MPVGTPAYRDWVKRGRPYRLAVPILELKLAARAQGIPFLGDLGNQAHLIDPDPEDHTPFSETAYPVSLPDYVVCALDLGHGPWSHRLLADAKAGRLPWLKYLNFAGGNYSVKRNWEWRKNADQHLHISIMSSHTWYRIAPYNPFAPVPTIYGGVNMVNIIRSTNVNGSTAWFGIIIGIGTPFVEIMDNGSELAEWRRMMTESGGHEFTVRRDLLPHFGIPHFGNKV